MNRQIEINIDEISLSGFPPQDRVKIMQSFHESLMQLFTGADSQSLQFTGGALASVEGSSFNMHPHIESNTLGTHIAQSVYSAIIGY